MRAEPGRLLSRTACIAIVLIVGLDAAWAQGDPFGVARPEPNLAPQEGPLSGLFAWIAAQQAMLYRALSSLVIEFRTNPAAGLVLIGLSFVYGVLHAAGPGHGKVIISSYLVASGETVRRGILVSFAAALAQALTAIALVALFTIVLRATSFAMTQATAIIEIASYGLVTALGAWLVLTKSAAILRPLPAGPAGHVHGAAGDHHHASGACCAHQHTADPALLKGSFSFKRAAAAVAAVGLRPCTGAVLVLVFAFSQGVFWVGIASALAMAAGTGMTVALLAAIAVGARGMAGRLARGGSHWSLTALRGVELLAALAVLLFGLALLGGALFATG